MRKFALIGYKLGHSFSKKYFTDKFEKEGLDNCLYELFELAHIKQLPGLLIEQKSLEGLNVTIPYKEEVIPLLDDIDDSAKRIGAVNVIRIQDGKTKGFNSDYYGFKKSLEDWMDINPSETKALILGTGGASKAVKTALEDLNVEFKFVSRTASDDTLDYASLNAKPELLDEYRLIINTTPLGMLPNTDSCPDLPYDRIGGGHYLYDLVYNPEETLFMKKGTDRGAKAKNGLEMLHLQAERSWDIWNGNE
ncbi:shikimate 5-dehydrogenase [Fulvitalea axinellae]|uniref:Shikimate 5-dehydrogenase n=1 Tax=Fulvitalea axinellae TaxID=1182444 RepID=A0AAU9CLU3_9BACT|nr:shikimate 5-dehydrogenase [Fulvitalea axinellae]